MYWILIICYFFTIRRFVDTRGLICSFHSDWWTYFTYPLYHENIFHLALNCYAILIYWNFLKHRISQTVMLLILATTVPLSGMIASFSGTGGSSTIASGLMGIYLALYPHTYRRYILMFAFNGIVSLMFPVNFLIHLVAMIISFVMMRMISRFVYVII